MKLIELDALIVEIERRKKEEVSYDEDSKSFASYAAEIHYSTLDSIEDFINTFEVKGVDFDFTKEVDMWIEDNGDSNGFFNVDDLAKYFFKLGMAASNKAQKGE